ncbi:PiggyBac transposable element-derived protein 5 [Lamellibrachia satsuma]|nr:PiggyBac transposable element-derived protein 5 [Lamellibrachia satsuma]
MAGSSGAGDASFDVSFETDSDEEFGGFYARDVDLVEERIRDRPGEFGRESDDEIDVSDFENSDISSSDDDTVILDPDDSDDSDAVPVLPQERQWTEHLVDPPDIAFVDAANVGVNNAEQCCDMTAEQLFGLFFTDYLFRLIVGETNRYADQCMKKAPKKGRKHTEWSEVTIPELKTWLGLLLAMGIVQKKGRLGEYWSTHWLTQTPGFNDTMPRNRFLQILRYIHFVDNEDPSIDKTNKMWKVQNVLDYLNKRFRAAYHPRRELSIDETMLKFKGRLSIKQYIKIKPVKWGIKIFTLVEAKTGYVLNLLPYVGKHEDTAVGKTTQTVLDVGKHYLNKGHRFFTDNYYTSVELMTKLEDKNTLSCGTVNSNRVGLPKDMKKTCPAVKKLKRGESLKRMKGRMLAVTWKDTRVVNLLCNVPGCLDDAAVQRRDKKHGGAEITVSRPRAIELYNTFMGGVDLSDQRVSSYRRHMKSLTWYLQVFFHLVQLSGVQAFLLHRELHPARNKAQLKFFVALIDGLVAGRTFTQKRHTPSALPSADVRFNRTLEHAPIKHETQSKCAVHTKRVDTLYACGVCKVRMCPVPCFHRYHYMTEYAYDDPHKVGSAPARKRKR